MPDIKDQLKLVADRKPERLVISPLKWRYLIRSILRGRNLMMTGPSGCGKTLAAQSAAEAFGKMELETVVSEAELEKLRQNETISILSVEEV